MSDTQNLNRPGSQLGWVRVVPFFLSAFLYLTQIFAFLAPLPLLVLGLQNQRRWAYLAVLTNLGLVTAFAPSDGAWVYLILSAVPAIVLFELLRKGKRLEFSVLMTLAAMIFSGAGIFMTYASIKGVSPWVELQAQVTTIVDYLTTALTQSNREQVMGDMDPELLKRNILIELPWTLLVFGLITIVFNLLAVLRLNPNLIRERLGVTADTFAKWKVSEYLIWPTLASGAGLVLGVGWVEIVSLNLFKFLMAFYAIQGLSIFRFCFDAWKVRPGFRALFYSLAVFLMLPLVLSLGFFDLWFDFRAKLRQS